MAGGPVRGLSARALLPLVLAACALAAWRIGLTLAGPPVRPPTVLGLLEESSARGTPAAGRRDLPAPGAEAVARARARLRAEPLSAEAYAVLALAAETAGEGARAERLMAVAAAWWPRDLLVQTWLLARNLRQGDATAAMANLDTAVRAEPETLDDLTAALAPLMAEPAGRAALAARLAENPPWRTRFIQIAVRQWRAPQGLVALLARVQAVPPGLGTEELRPYLTALLAAGQVEEAYAAWLRSLSPARRAGLAFLYNGDFRFPLTQMPFDWQTPMVAGATAAIDAAGGRPVLSIGFLGGRVAAQPVLHALVLAPGAYRLSGQVRTDRLRSEGRIRWRIACLSEPDGTLAGDEALNADQPFAGTAPWRAFTLDVTVPEEGCAGQSLGLEVHGRTAPERQASGVVSFSALAIEPR